MSSDGKTPGTLYAGETSTCDSNNLKVDIQDIYYK